MQGIVAERKALPKKPGTPSCPLTSVSQCYAMVLISLKQIHAYMLAVGMMNLEGK
jgi:hypothetical protein